MKNIIKASYLFLVFFLTYQSVKAQDNVTNSLDADAKIGTLLYNKTNNNFYLKFKDCVDSTLYKVKIDEQNWKVNYPKLLSMNDAVALNQFSLPIHYYRLNFYLKNSLKNDLKSYSSILKNEIKKGGTYYIGREGIPYSIERREGVYKIPGEGEIEIKKKDTMFQFSFKYKELEKQVKNIESEPIEKIMFTLTPTAFNQFNCFSVDDEKEKGSISFEVESGYNIAIIDFSKDQYYKDGYSSNFGYNYIEKKFMSKKRSLLYLSEYKSSEIEEYYEKTKAEIETAKTATSKMFGQVSPKYSDAEIKQMQSNLENKYKYLKENGTIMNVTETAKDVDDKLKKIETTEFYPGLTFIPNESKVFNNYVFKGGFDNFNDSLVQIMNLTDYQFKGYTENNMFVLTSNAVDPLKRFINFATQKFNYNELIEFCPNQPNTIKKLEELNTKLSDYETKINIAQSAVSRYTFNMSEQKDASGAIITEVKVLKDCKNLDLNNQTERENLKTLLKDRNNKIVETIGDLSGVVRDYITLNNEINGCQVKQEASGSALLDGLSKLADKATKFGLKASLVGTTARATKLLENSKKANEELKNYNKVLESYKKSN